ncbi:hypothetical protein DFJ77DRAFT_303045 [Powellomyces hirtus]|nr:hypothetical protein DFJ77DRAFT_303045 [Powellomyces hirtus]
MVHRNKNLYLLQAEEDIRGLEARVQEQDDEMAGLISGGDAPYVTELRTLREDNEDLEKRNDALTNHLAETEELLSTERSAVREINAQLTTERARAAAAEEVVARMKAEIKDYQSQLQNRKDRIQLKNLDDDQIRKQLREKNGELARYVAEVELLSSRNARLTSEVEALTQELEVTVTELERKEKDEKETEQIVLHNDMTIDQLNAEKVALRTKLEDLTRQVEKAGSQDERFLSDLQAEVQHYEKAMHESEAASAAKDAIIEQLRADIVHLQEELRPSNIGAFHKQLLEKDDEIRNLQGKLDESYRDFELLSLDWDQIDQALQSQSGIDLDALRGQLDSVHRLKDKLEAYKSRHRKTLQKIRAADSQLESKESQLVSLQNRIHKYESTVYGLPEAAREIKELQLRLRKKEKDLLLRSQQLNATERQVGELVDENTELRVRLGCNTVSPIDVSNIRNILSVELERSRALNTQLRSEIDTLEEERLQLKAAMRLYAIDKGDRAVALGLTADSLADVEDYAERLRIKTGAPVNSKRTDKNTAPVATSMDQLDRISIELERAQVDAGEAREEAKKLESEARRLKNDKSRLEAAIKEVSLTLVQLSADNGDGWRNASAAQFTAVHKLIAMLEKNQRISNEGNLNDLDAGKDVLLVNKTLREDIRAARAVIGKTRDELVILRTKNKQIEKDRDHWKNQVLNPPPKHVELPASLLMGSQADYVALVEKLAECLEDSKAKDRAIHDSDIALKRYQNLYSVLVGRQRHLYRNYQKLKVESTESIAKLSSEVQEVKTGKETADIQIQSLERTVRDLSGPPNDIKTHLVDAQRKCMIMKVNEKALTRRYQALQEVEGGLRRELDKVQNSQY